MLSVTAVDDTRPAGKPGKQHADRRPGEADRHVSRKRQRRDEDGQQPDLVRIDGKSRAELAIGQERQQDHGHRGEDQAGAQLLPRQPFHPFVQCGLEREQQGRRDACCCGGGLVAHHGERAEGERQHGRDDGCGAEGLLVHHLAVAEDRDRRRECGERKGERDHAGLAGVQRKRTPDAAEQP